MTSNRTILLAAAISLALVGSANAQSAVSDASAQGQASGKAEMQSMASNASATARAEARAEANADAQATLESIRKKGGSVSAEARAKAEAKLDAEAKRCNDEARARGDAKVAARLAAEFGVTADQLTAEKNQLHTSWGELMIAHCLDANSKVDVTASQLFELRQEGCGWGQIAAGMGLKLGDTVNAVRAESRVATGLAAADGKVAVIHGPGAQAGVGAGAGAGVGAGAGSINAGGQVGAGVGIKIKP